MIYKKKEPYVSGGMTTRTTGQVSMAAAQAQFDDDMLKALLLSESLSPPLPSELSTQAGTSPEDPSEEAAEAAAAAARPRWTQMVQEGRVSARELQVDSEQFFPSLGAEPFPTLGGSPAGRSPPAARSPPAGWGKAPAAAAAAGGGWGARAAAPSKAGSSVKQGWKVKGDVRRGGDDTDVFEMDDLEEEMSAEERQRRRDEAAAM